jgi:hypothetical protein
VTRPAATVRGPGPGGWRESIPELIIAGVVIGTSCLAVYGFAGLAAAVIAASLWAIGLLIALRALVPPASAVLAPPEQDTTGDRGQTTFFGFWRSRAILVDGTQSLAAYDQDLGKTLQHLLAARLAERHGVSLAADPQRARQLLLRGEQDQDDLWRWLDPARPPETDRRKPGIPPRTLDTIIDLLERL